MGNKNEDTFVSDFLHRSEKKVRRQQKPFGVHRSLRNPFVAVFQEFRVCWQPKSHYIKSLHCFAEIFFFPLRFWVCKLMLLGVSLMKRRIVSPWYQISNGPGRSQKYCFAPLLMGWKITGETPRKRRRLRCNDVRTFSREDFFWMFHPPKQHTTRFDPPRKLATFFQ